MDVLLFLVNVDNRFDMVKSAVRISATTYNLDPLSSPWESDYAWREGLIAV